MPKHYSVNRRRKDSERCPSPNTLRLGRGKLSVRNDMTGNFEVLGTVTKMEIGPLPLGSVRPLFNNEGLLVEMSITKEGQKFLNSLSPAPHGS